MPPRPNHPNPIITRTPGKRPAWLVFFGETIYICSRSLCPRRLSRGRKYEGLLRQELTLIIPCRRRRGTRHVVSYGGLPREIARENPGRIPLFPSSTSQARCRGMSRDPIGLPWAAAASRDILRHHTSLSMVSHNSSRDIPSRVY